MTSFEVSSSHQQFLFPTFSLISQTTIVKMIIAYDKTDKESPNFLDEQIVEFRMVRSPQYDFASVKKWVKETDGEDGSQIYRHYVPFQRIWQAISSLMLMKTRREVLGWLIKRVLPVLKLEEDEFLKRYADPMENRMAFDIWLDWAVGSICDWKENIYYGDGEGDHAGSELDKPTGPKKAAIATRVEAAAETLAKVISGLSIEQRVNLTDPGAVLWGVSWEDDVV
jgi:hypothetical protein